MPDEVALPEDEARRRARAVVYDALREYAQKRVIRYQTLTLAELLQKDLLMMAMRGVTSREELLDAAFVAFESSSEETQMGNFTQRIATDLAERAIDLSDVVVEKDGDLWIIEVKSQTNTITGTYRNDALRKMYSRMRAMARPRRVRGGRVRALLGVVRGKPVDRQITAHFPAGDDYADIDGFTYEYKVGRPFWEWLTGLPGIGSLVDVLPEDAHDVAAAREVCRVRLQGELVVRLGEHGLGQDIPAVLKLADELYH